MLTDFPQNVVPVEYVDGTITVDNPHPHPNGSHSRSDEQPEINALEQLGVVVSYVGSFVP